MGVRAIEKYGQYREAAQVPHQEETTMTAPDDPEVLRKEILIMLKKISGRGSVLFFQWLLSFRKLEARRSCSGEPCRFPGIRMEITVVRVRRHNENIQRPSGL